MEARPNLPIQVLSFCGTDGQLQPIRFRLEDEERQLQTVSIEEIVSVNEVPYVGVEALVYLCRARLGGRERLIELRYAIRSHRWVLRRLIL